jgi:hypothetical protein
MKVEIDMTSITLPPEIEGPLREEACRRGTSPELLALDALRVRFAPPVTSLPDQCPEPTLADFLNGYVGIVEGSTEALSERCGERFAEPRAERGAEIRNE